MFKEFFREFFNEFNLILRAIPTGLKNVGVAIYKGIPTFFKGIVPGVKRLGSGIVRIFGPHAAAGATTGATIFKTQMLVKGLLVFSLVTLGVGTVVYGVSNLVVENSMATITVAGTDNKWGENSDTQGTLSISLSETQDFEKPTVTLNCKGIRDLTNISGTSLPSEIDSIDGSHNGEHYVAYTFYVKNTGDIAGNIREEMTIKNSVKNVDEAIRVRIYRNGEYITYAKLGADGLPEVGTVPFTDDTVFSQTRKAVPPETIIKYTLVIWLEGDDPECLDDLKGGAVSMSMTFSIDPQDDG